MMTRPEKPETGLLAADRVGPEKSGRHSSFRRVGRVSHGNGVRARRGCLPQGRRTGRVCGQGPTPRQSAHRACGGHACRRKCSRIRSGVPAPGAGILAGPAYARASKPHRIRPGAGGGRRSRHRCGPGAVPPGGSFPAQGVWRSDRRAKRQSFGAGKPHGSGPCPWPN